jgi:hypothetical protein
MSEGINVEKIKPIGNHVLVRKCRTAKPDLIEVPDAYREQCEFVEILAVGMKCKHLSDEHVGKMLQCPDFSEDMHSIDDNGEFWMCRETIFEPIVFG